MAEVFLRSIAGHRVGIGVVSLGLFLISPSHRLHVRRFRRHGGLRGVCLRASPRVLKALFRAQGGFAANANGYLAADYRHPIYLIAVLAFVISVAVGAVAREVERGSALLVLSAPVSLAGATCWRRRRRCSSARWSFSPRRWAAPGRGVIITGITDQVDMVVFLRVQANTLALALAVGGIALVVSSRGSDAGQATGIATGIIATMYFIDFLSLIWSPAGPLGPFTVFHYYDPHGVSQEPGLPWRDILVLGFSRRNGARCRSRDLPAARYRPLIGRVRAGMDRNGAGLPLVDSTGLRGGGRIFRCNILEHFRLLGPGRRPLAVARRGVSSQLRHSVPFLLWVRPDAR